MRGPKVWSLGGFIPRRNWDSDVNVNILNERLVLLRVTSAVQFDMESS
jgi:hypothetical protein